MIPHGIIYERGGVQDWQALAKEVEKFPGVVAAAPLTRLQGMMAYQGRVQGAMVTGIDPVAEHRVSILPDHMIEGELSSLTASGFNVVLGEILASRLHLVIGDKVTLMLPEATLSPAGILPRIKRLTVSGIFSVGAELDANLAVIHLSDARKLARLAGEAQALRIKTEDLFIAPKLVWQLVSEVDGIYSGSDWTRTHGNLFKAIKMEKTMIGLLLLIIVAVAAFNIVATLVMVVTDKQADIAILRTMGATPRTILQIFMVQGLAIGVVGVALGTLLGIIGALTVSDVIAWIEQISGTQFLSGDVYFISYLPSQLLWSDVAVITSSALLLSFLATIYPAVRASKIQPAEALRYE
jgi:lipoprotein-releasing system permease protein